MRDHHPTSLLDTCMRRAHCVRLFGRTYHPYHISNDVGIGAILLFSAWFAATQAGLTLLGFIVAFAAMQGSYVLARLIRWRISGNASRSFLQDTVLIVLPSFIAANLLVGNDLAPSLDLAGLDLALGLSFIRIGCFFGGCCYGRPARWGVLYTPEHLKDVRGCRNYTSGPVPHGRVIPIQLFESAVNAAMFAALLIWRMHSPSSRGRVLPAYLIGYAVWRFGSDFWRAVSVRPRWAGLSQAQWYAMAVCAVMVVALIL
jgi:phosphatidylglycerol---prolipoprotein diacylglyceryl transferase